MSTTLALTPDGLEPLRGDYPPEIIISALYALAAHGGHSGQAHATLTEQHGPNNIPPERTLRRWRTDRYPIRYHQILTEQTTQLETLVEHQLRETLRLTGLTKHRILERLADNINNINPTDLGKTAQQLAVTEGVAVDKLLTLTGRPNNITEHRTADEILNSLEAKHPTHHTITSTATEEPTTGP